MSAIAEKVAAEHQLVQHGGLYEDEPDACGCGWSQRTYGHTFHVAAVTEAAVRAQIAADIENLEHTREEVRERQVVGYSVVWAEGYDEAVTDAARIAAGGAS